MALLVMRRLAACTHASVAVLLNVLCTCLLGRRCRWRLRWRWYSSRKQSSACAPCRAAPLPCQVVCFSHLWPSCGCSRACCSPALMAAPHPQQHFAVLSAGGTGGAGFFGTPMQQTKLCAEHTGARHGHLEALVMVAMQATRRRCWQSPSARTAKPLRAAAATPPCASGTWPRRRRTARSRHAC